MIQVCGTPLDASYIPVFDTEDVVDSYRLYCLDGTGRIDLAEWIIASSDEDAVQRAKAMKNGALKCEVWQRDRLIARLSFADLAS